MDNALLWKVIDSYFQENPQALVSHHIESYNDFFKTGIFQIFKEKNPITLETRFDEKINDYRSKCILYFGGKDGKKVYFGKPVIYDENNAHYMCPNEARLRNMSYGMTVHYDIDIEFVTLLEDGETPFLVGAEDATVAMEEEQDEIAYTNFKENVAKEAGTDDQENREEEQDKIEGGAPMQRKRQKKKVLLEMTPAQQALFKELTEKSIVGPNKQLQTLTLEKIYLGKFPIMVQSEYCILHGLAPDLRHTMGECKNDIGGYFIIDGKEKTVVSQEKFADNMLYIREVNDDTYLYSAEIRSVSENVSKPIRTLSVKTMASTSKYTFQNIVVAIPNVRKPVPLFILFRALGVLSDKKIISMCLLDLEKYESMIDLFAPSVHDAGGILTQRNALKYIATLTKGKTTTHAMEILADYFLPHIGEINFMEKAYYLGYIVFRLLSVSTGIELPTDRDNFKYKRIELVGSLMYDLFREYYTIQQRKIHLLFEEKITYNKDMYENDLYKLIMQNYKTIFLERIVDAGFKKAFKGNWGAQSHTKRVGIVQDLNRLSFNSALSHLRKTNLPLDASVKLIGPRVLHNTQWGFFDPIDTPDGGNIGIHKHLSISAYITQGYSREKILDWLREMVDMKRLVDCSPDVLSTMTKIMVNGYWAGALSDPIETVEKIKLFRRNALLPIYTSVTFDIKKNTIFIYTDAGRICRPIFYKDEETGKMSIDIPFIQKRLTDDEFTWTDLITGFHKKHVENFSPKDYKFYDFQELYKIANLEEDATKRKRFYQEKAVIDYIDTNETEDALIALSKEDMEKNPDKKYTHLEIHESLIFGMMCNIINFPENNPATRNSFSCGQSKQACSLYHTNHQVRMDKTAVVLVSGQTPVVKTRYLEYINHEENPYGENAIVAIMCYTGYNVEDAILVNEGALKRGLFRTTYYSCYEAHEEKSSTGGVSVDKKFTNIESESNVIGTKPGYDYSKLDKYGLIRENTPVDDKTVLIGLSTNISSDPSHKIDGSKTPKKGQLGIVDKTFITEGEEGTRIAKVRVREERIPNVGDKMASRSGQKGTIGLVIPESDMPFTKDGIRPDLIINPHAIPSRMTIGQLVETIVGKASCMYGGYADCTAFNNKGSKIEVFGQLLTKVGYHSSGNEILYNGMTGEQIQAEIFMGPNYYMRLKHMVKDKINYRALGPRTALTKQPVSGRANDGGLRIGEMERDAVISHGMSDFLRESMMERGDKYYMAICNQTGMMTVFNPAKNLFFSPMVDGPIRYTGTLEGKDLKIDSVTRFGRDFSVVCVPYSLKLLVQELQTINIQMRLITEDNIQQLENMSFSKNMDKLLHVSDMDPKTIVSSIRETLQGKRKDVYKAPASYHTPTPDVASPAYPAELSPNYPTEVSPAYQPSLDSEPTTTDSPIYQPYSPESVEQSTIYEPVSPTSPPPTEIRPTIYEPLSPTSPPPKDLTGGTPESLDFLSEQAKQYQVGDSVHYRGDVLPTRIWTVAYVGDRFLKIETPMVHNMEGLDTTLMVTALDIYKPTDFPMVGGGTVDLPTPVSVPISYPGEGLGGGVIPPINFAPVFKIMNGGNDFSTESPQTKEEETFAPTHPFGLTLPTPTSAPIPAVSEGGAVAAPVAEKIDFSKLLIKKI
jgi:DNA-directed RNA polymerase II subunit RPB2